MKLEIFDIFDSATASYHRPFFMLSKTEAIRAFIDIINDEKSAIHKHPEDFTLFHLGTFNQETAEFTFPPSPTSLGKAIEFLLDGRAYDQLAGRPPSAGSRVDGPLESCTTNPNGD